jgi:hypothetical protein
MMSRWFLLILPISFYITEVSSGYRGFFVAEVVICVLGHPELVEDEP